jgi:hypothetical protein
MNRMDCVFRASKFERNGKTEPDDSFNFTFIQLNSIPLSANRGDCGQNGRLVQRTLSDRRLAPVGHFPGREPLKALVHRAALGGRKPTCAILRLGLAQAPGN